jgi:hypothetical protein
VVRSRWCFGSASTVTMILDLATVSHGAAHVWTAVNIWSHSYPMVREVMHSRVDRDQPEGSRYGGNTLFAEETRSFGPVRYSES